MVADVCATKQTERWGHPWPDSAKMNLRIESRPLISIEAMLKRGRGCSQAMLGLLLWCFTFSCFSPVWVFRYSMCNLPVPQVRRKTDIFISIAVLWRHILSVQSPAYKCEKLQGSRGVTSVPRLQGVVHDDNHTNDRVTLGRGTGCFVCAWRSTPCHCVCCLEYFVS